MDEAIRALVGARALLVASLAYVLETLQRVTEDPAVEQDIVQLRGLAKRMETAAFLPLERGRSRRRNSRAPSARLPRPGPQDRAATQEGRVGDERKVQPTFLPEAARRGLRHAAARQVRARFGVELGAWRDSGITPLWCVS